MMHTSLLHHYEKIFAFRQYHQWNIAEIEELIPWEMEAYEALLSNYLETVELHKKQARANQNK